MFLGGQIKKMAEVGFGQTTDDIRAKGKRIFDLKKGPRPTSSASSQDQEDEKKTLPMSPGRIVF